MRDFAKKGNIYTQWNQKHNSLTIKMHVMSGCAIRPGGGGGCFALRSTAGDEPERDRTMRADYALFFCILKISFFRELYGVYVSV